MAEPMKDMHFSSTSDGFDGGLLSPTLFDDRLQTVPDLDHFMTIQSQCTYQAQEVPDYPVQFSFNEETTPVKLEQLYQKSSKITPLMLNFEEPREMNVKAQQGTCRKSESVKRKKSKRRSYLSSDLPAEIRNKRRNVANARERARVERMANGYTALQNSLPKYLTQPKMRKVDILNSALCHIQNLMNMLSANSLDINQNTMPLCEVSDQYSEDGLKFQDECFQNDFPSDCLTQFIQCNADDIHFMNSSS